MSTVIVIIGFPTRLGNGDIGLGLRNVMDRGQELELGLGIGLGIKVWHRVRGWYRVRIRD